jgi:hypothetical protein
MGSPESTAPPPGKDEPSPVYVPFALARANVMKALDYPDDAAAEWLRQAALDGRVRARFSERHLKMHPTNLRLAGHPANLTEAERALPYPQPISPLDDLKRSPAAMAEHHIIHETEWDAGQLRAALGASVSTEPTPASAQPAAVKADRKGIGGRKRKYPWDELGAGFGAWLHDQTGRAGLGDNEHLDALAALAHELGCEPPPRQTAQPYLAKWLRGFSAFLKID